MKETTGQFLEKAGRAILAAKRLLEARDTEFAAGRAYYAMFYLAEALLNEKGIHLRSTGASTAPSGNISSRPGSWMPGTTGGY